MLVLAVPIEMARLVTVVALTVITQVSALPSFYKNQVFLSRLNIEKLCSKEKVKLTNSWSIFNPIQIPTQK